MEGGIPEQLTELLAYLWFNHPPKDFAALTNRLALGSRETLLAEAKESLATSLSPVDIARRAFDPYDFSDLSELSSLTGIAGGQNPFTSDDGTFRLVFVQARTELSGYQACSRWLASIRTAVDGLRNEKPAWRGVTVHYTGSPAYVTEIASGMQRDLSGSVMGTALIIAILFWLAHRRWLPMLWLLTLLALILAVTLALGGLLLGSISVVSMGFAAVLLGLAVDYAVVHYQEALSHPNLTVPEIRRAISPSILWAAITTICAFLTLNLGGLPGLAQLGSLVAIGVALAAWVMVMIFLPPLFPKRRHPPVGGMRASFWDYLIPPREVMTAAVKPSEVNRTGLWLTVLIVVAAGIILCLKPPRVDRTADALRPERGEAESTLQEVTDSLGIPQDALWLFVNGQTESEVGERLARVEPVLSNAVSGGFARDFVLAAPLWPRLDYQQSNRAAASQLVALGPSLKQSALDAGFNSDALILTDELLKDWSAYGQTSGIVWPTNQTSRWLMNRFTAHSTNGWLIMGLVYPATNRPSTQLAACFKGLDSEGIYLSGWELLGSSTFNRVRERMWMMVAPMIILILASLWLAFRNPVEIGLGLAVLALGGLCLQTVMVLAGWSWNLLNLMAVPLMLGTGVDYGIFIQLALRRHGGDLNMVRKSIGRALLLCGGTAVAGFGSLGFSSNPGMASLGRVCAAGIAANMLIAVYLLPSWWHWARRQPKSCGVQEASGFYRAWFWQLGLRLVKILPSFLLRGLCRIIAEACWVLYRSRREVAIENLLPVVNGNRVEAQKQAHALFRQFGLKLMDLWRFESGQPVRNWITAGSDWDILGKRLQTGQRSVVAHAASGQLGIGRAALARAAGGRANRVNSSGTGKWINGIAQGFARPLGNPDAGHRRGWV